MFLKTAFYQNKQTKQNYKVGVYHNAMIYISIK